MKDHNIEPIKLADVKDFYRFVKPYRFRAILSILASVAMGMCDGVIPLILKPFMDEVILGDGSVSVSFFPLLIILFAVIQSGFSFTSSYLTTWVGRHIGNDVKMALFKRLIHADPATFDKSTSGEIMVRYAGDADAASNNLVGDAKLLVNRFVTSTFLICVLFYISWILALVAVGALVLAIVPLSRVRKKMKEYVKESLKTGAAAGTCYTETYLGNRVITSYNLYDFSSDRLDRSLRQMFRIGIKRVQRTSFLSLCMHFATSTAIAITVWLQGYLILSGHITPGDFVAFMAALLSLYQPLKKVGNNVHEIQISLMAIQRVQALLKEEPLIVSRPDAKPLGHAVGAVRYDNVHFSYEPGRPVLKGISLDIAPGTATAFVGNSGGGKTTLVNLLPRFYDVDSGSVSIDGVDVRDIELNSLRDNIAIVFQDNFLFGGTIRDNIVLGKQDASDEQIMAAIRAACLEEFVGGLALGLDTQIGERGVMLSGGQKQRIAIARAFIKDAPIVILDEATSALDNRSEIVVQRAIENLMKLNKTVLIVAHRLSTVKNADRIVVIRDGVMAEAGRHDELLAKGGVYASLYQTQLV